MESKRQSHPTAPFHIRKETLAFGCSLILLDLVGVISFFFMFFLGSMMFNPHPYLKIIPSIGFRWILNLSFCCLHCLVCPNC